MNLTSLFQYVFQVSKEAFPICLCFAMTTTKSQGQALSKVEFYLPRPVFTYGQLYVIVSTVKTKRKGLKILITDEDGDVTTTTKNVVYKNIIENL